MFHRFPSDLSANKGVVLSVEANKFNDDHNYCLLCSHQTPHAVGNVIIPY